MCRVKLSLLSPSGIEKIAVKLEGVVRNVPSAALVLRVSGYPSRVAVALGIPAPVCSSMTVPVTSGTVTL